MSKHTPGPWTLVNESSMGPRGDVSFNHQLLAGDLWLCAIASGDYESREEVERERERIEANLSVIKAAPDLLGAVEADSAGEPVPDLLRTAAALMNQQGGGPLVDRLMLAADAIEDAIAKAEGR